MEPMSAETGVNQVVVDRFQLGSDQELIDMEERKCSMKRCAVPMACQVEGVSE